MFTIIIPTFNSANTIAKCLDSIVKQVFLPFEVWIIDGISSDETISIVKEYQTQYPFIHYVSEKDKGIYDAMNKGIALAKGEWLYFLGSDDSLYDSEVLKKIKQYIKAAKNPKLVYGDVLFQISKKRYSGKFSVIELIEKNICHQSIFYHKSIFDQQNRYDQHHAIIADWILNVKTFFTLKGKFNYINIIVANYTETGFSNNYSSTQYQQDKQVLLSFFPFYFRLLYNYNHHFMIGRLWKLYKYFVINNYIKY